MQKLQADTLTLGSCLNLSGENLFGSGKTEGKVCPKVGDVAAI